MVQWARDGTTRCSGFETFDLRTGAFIGRVYDDDQHSDEGVMPDGITAFLMAFDVYMPNGPGIGIRGLPGTSTVSPPRCIRALDWGNMEHISCRGPYGVGLVTAGTWDVNGWTAFEGEVFLQYTDGSVLRLAHHRSSSCGYWVQPRATVSRDGRYVVFASDWGGETGTSSCHTWNDHLGRGDPYLIDLGKGAPAATPTPASNYVNLGASLASVSPGGRSAFPGAATSARGTTRTSQSTSTSPQ